MDALDDLNAAREELRCLEEKWANYSGNNPNKLQADIKAARQNVRRIEERLKATGVIPLTAQETLERELDAAFPKARSKQIVEHKGRRYQRRFAPLETSRSGKTVTEWGRSWIDITDAAP